MRRRTTEPRRAYNDDEDRTYVSDRNRNLSQISSEDAHRCTERVFLLQMFWIRVEHIVSAKALQKYWSLTFRIDIPRALFADLAVLLWSSQWYDFIWKRILWSEHQGFFNKKLDRFFGDYTEDTFLLDVTQMTPAHRVCLKSSGDRAGHWNLQYKSIWFT